mmetsp:Transcript_25910/g.78050  ORF Transcript_25910/g.78050 Transcript_25910/m.78050 type:complete len:296 (-) Transcript_25910:447-1334(-)
MPTRGTGVGNPKYYKCLASRFYGGTDFVGAAREAQQAVRIVRDVQGEHSSISFYEIPFAIASANGGGHVSYLLTLCGGEIGLKTLSTSQPWGSWSCSSAYNHLREDSVICSRAPMRQRVLSWRLVVTSDYEVWTSPDCKHTHPRVHAVLQQSIFMYCITCVGSTVNTIFNDRLQNQCKPHLDRLEIVALLLDLCDRGALRMDRCAPAEPCKGQRRPRTGVTLFSQSKASRCVSLPLPTTSILQTMLAIQGIDEENMPRFFANHNTLHNLVGWSRGLAPVAVSQEEPVVGSGARGK